jgi:NADH:ubiquinone oxidoreductase subunit K
MISVDLLFLSGLLFVISLTDIISFERPITQVLSIFYLFWGFAWLIQLLALKSSPKNYLNLSQWIFWIISSGLLYWGS